MATKQLVNEFAQVNKEHQDNMVLGGRTIHLAFMGEKVAAESEAAVKRVCKEQGVMLFGRSGHAISLVSLDEGFKV